MLTLLLRARRTWWVAVAIAVLRIFVGFAFVPAGLKKVLGQPFTDPHLHGPFHDFLHAFHQTGWFYRFVGAVQLLAALLLMTGRFAPLGAVLAMPILTTIAAFCWSTKVYPTAGVVTLIWLGSLVLLLWDLPRWRGVLGDERSPLDRRLWEACGTAVLGLYLGTCIIAGTVYRPRGATWQSPAFYVFPAMLLIVIVTIFRDRRRRAGQRAQASGSAG